MDNLPATARSSVAFVRRVFNLNPFRYLVGKSYVSLARRERDWVLRFDDNSTFCIACLWRLLCSGRIVLTSADEGQQFGLPSPVIAADTANSKLGGCTITSVELIPGTLDLAFTFDNGMTFQIIPDSSGYEAWNACTPGSEIIAVGGGELSVYPKTEAG